MTNRPAQTARYLIELVAPAAGWEDIERMTRRARGAASTADGGARFIRSIFVPEDSRFYLLYEAGSAQEAQLAVARAELEVAGIVQTLRSEPEGETPCRLD